MIHSFLPETLVDYADIFTAVGTVGSVIVSLLLSSRRRPKPSITLKCVISRAIIARNIYSNEEYITFSTVNEGEYDAVITGLGWTVKKTYATQTVPEDEISAKLPVRISHGESANFYLPLQGWIHHLKTENPFFELIKKRKDCDHIRALIRTSVGKPTLCKPSEEILDLIWEHYSAPLHTQNRETKKS